MQYRIALGVAVGLLVVGGAGAAPPPGAPAGVPLGPPIQLRAPTAGGAVFERVTIKGKLKPGTTDPHVTLALDGRPPANVRVVGGHTAPKTAGGVWSEDFYVAVGDVGKTKRRLDAVLGPTTVDFFGIPSYWFQPPQFFSVLMPCAKAREIYRKLTDLRVIYGFTADKAITMWEEALKKERC